MISVHNEEKRIDDVLFKNFTNDIVDEILIINNGSTDNTTRILSKYNKEKIGVGERQNKINRCCRQFQSRQDKYCKILSIRNEENFKSTLCSDTCFNITTYYGLCDYFTLSP